MQWNAKWIRPAEDTGDVCPLFSRHFSSEKPIRKAELSITALGIYEAHINEKRVGRFVLAPGWTSYEKRLQYQTYDVTALLERENDLTVTVAPGWYRGRRLGWDSKTQAALRANPAGLLAQMTIFYEDGSSEQILTDENWHVSESQIRFSDIYDGERFDASFEPDFGTPAVSFDGPFETLIPQQGEEVTEQERIHPVRIFTTPKGEVVLDFGQNLTGCVKICVNARSGDRVMLSHAEVLDKDGNFYTQNYRSAKAGYTYICRSGQQTWHPTHTFYGFRYIRIDAFPGGPQAAKPEQFEAIAFYSDMKRTGYLSCSDPLLNQLFSNILWGQRSNFADVPTDCPQRDERLGWTGDAQVFIRTACYNYDTKRFFTKWLADMAADQGEDGYIGHVIPDLLHSPNASAAWGDAAAVCPWELYLAYGDKELLAEQFNMMEKWVGYITAHTTTPYLWTGGEHYGDWLGLDAPSGSYKGSSREDFIASAFYAYSTSLVILAGEALGKDMTEYKTLYQNILAAFRMTYPDYRTQTECVLAAHFGLAPDCQAAADLLAQKVKDCGVRLETGFVGTPYLLHVLSDYGHADLAYSLLLRKEYPSWLYPVTKGATTIWEHWDGIMEDGSFWSPDMNSYNHYAYGSVADWVYGNAAGIRPALPGYEKVSVTPLPDERLDWLKASVMTAHGLIRSEWSKEGDTWRYEIETPVDAVITIGKTIYQVAPGIHIFFSKKQ